MNIAEWILVIMLALALLVFLILAIVLVIKLINLAGEAQKIITTGQGIAAKADDIVDNVKGMTSVGGIVKTFANRVMENQERRYAEEDAERAAAEKMAEDDRVINEAEVARREADRAESNARAAARASSRAKRGAETARTKADEAAKAKKSAKK